MVLLAIERSEFKAEILDGVILNVTAFQA